MGLGFTFIILKQNRTLAGALIWPVVEAPATTSFEHRLDSTLTTLTTHAVQAAVAIATSLWLLCFQIWERTFGHWPDEIPSVAPVHVLGQTIIQSEWHPINVVGEASRLGFYPGSWFASSLNILFSLQCFLCIDFWIQGAASGAKVAGTAAVSASRWLAPASSMTVLSWEMQR